ncbi:FliH/SctL family protein [uncultured Sphingomonas sp.]|uniref:FliH/SctL family protein n=1 Tax=uncultured Sphingomonas sp. TaxID=158754 RepID=UPI002611024F|nr:FliH/SctL family protein [uncultured Sphingomonas sp.]
MSRAFATGAEAQSVGGDALARLMAGMRGAFSAVDPGGPARGHAAYEPQGPVSFSPAPGPRHFSPAEPGTNPTEGWDPFDPLGAGAQPAQPAAEPLDSIAQARADGFAAGIAAAAQAALDARRGDSEAIDRLVAALSRLEGYDRETLARRLRQTVLYLVGRLVGESGVSADLLTGRIEAAVALLADSSEAAKLRLHPDDLKLVEGQLPDRTVAIADKGMERGGFSIETRTTVIEDGPTAWLTQLAAAIDRTALPDAH